MGKIHYFVKLPSGDMMMVDNLFEYGLLTETNYQSSFWKGMGVAALCCLGFSLLLYLVCFVFT